MSVHGIRAAEREAREIAGRTGGALVEVRMGDVPQVDVLAPTCRCATTLRRLYVSLEHGHTKPNVGCDWNDAASDVGLPNQPFRSPAP